MTIEIKISKKPVEYKKAINYLEKRLIKVLDKKSNELIWILEHPNTYTAGKVFNNSEILNVWCIALSDNGMFVAFGGEYYGDNGFIEVWNIKHKTNHKWKYNIRKFNAH